MTAVITSLLDTDLYKLTMMQCVLHYFPASMVEYKFQCRNQDNKNIAKLGLYLDEIKQEVQNLCNLKFTEDELEFLSGLDFIKSDFIEFLRLFKLNPDFINITKDENNNLDIIIKGPWLHTIMYEVPVLAIVNEIYFRNNDIIENSYCTGDNLLENKINLIKNYNNNKVNINKFKFTDFGTRRRFSKYWHEYVVTKLVQELPINFVGTSNVLLAKKFNLVPIGTMAHEFLQAAQALGPRLVDSQKFALEIWTQEYRGRLGIALTDIVGMDAFLNDFDLFFAKLFDGLRQDSGNPIEWGEKAIEHYNKLKIDPNTKRLIFSDALTIKSALNIFEHFYGRAKTAFGIGTSLTNDLGYEPIQIVIKMIKCNNQPVAKISDSPGKIMCQDQSYLDYLKQVFYPS